MRVMCAPAEGVESCFPNATAKCIAWIHACPGSVKSKSHATFLAIRASYLLNVIINSCWRMQMRGFTLLTATILTFGYGFAAQAAMKVDRAETIRRVSAKIETTTPTADANRVWYGGMRSGEPTAGLPAPCYPK